MCYSVELTVKLNDNAGTDSLALPVQSAYRLPKAEGTLWVRRHVPQLLHNKQLLRLRGNRRASRRAGSALAAPVRQLLPFDIPGAIGGIALVVRQ